MTHPTAGLTIERARVFDHRSTTVAESTVHCRDGMIVAIGGDPPAETSSGEYRMIDADGRLVTAGLIDAHFHANGVGLDLLQIEAAPSSYVASAARQRLERALRRGFTTVRDVAGGDLGLTRALGEGLIDGPRYLFAGRALSQTGGHGDPRPGHLDVCCGGTGHLCEVVDGVDDLRRAVRERLRTGSHVIKVFASGGVVSPTDPLRLSQYSADELRAVCDEAERRESYVAAHAYSPEAITHAVTNGVRTIEHGNLLDDATAALMAEHGAFLVPTLIAYQAMAERGEQLGLSEVSRIKNREVLAAGVGSIEIARRHGVRIGLGTDLMGDLETEQLREFELRCAVESARDLLVAATVTNATIIGRPELGVIDAATPADLVIFDDDPLETPAALWKSGRTVVRGGVVVA
jgi:imidazolonepropionase-like amidohydrolase